MTTSVTRSCFTTQHLQDQDQDRFFWSETSRSSRRRNGTRRPASPLTISMISKLESVDGCSIKSSLSGGGRILWRPHYRPATQLVTLLAKLSGAVYCNRSSLFVCLFVCGFVCLCVCGSATTITRICVHRSSPNWVCR